MEDKDYEQKKDADTVIRGWVAIDKISTLCCLHTSEPSQGGYFLGNTSYCGVDWESDGKKYLLDKSLFPYLSSYSDPIEVELIIKRKKNG